MFFNMKLRWQTDISQEKKADSRESWSSGVQGPLLLLYIFIFALLCIYLWSQTTQILFKSEFKIPDNIFFIQTQKHKTFVTHSYLFAVCVTLLESAGCSLCSIHSTCFQQRRCTILFGGQTRQFGHPQHGWRVSLHFKFFIQLLL